MENQKKYISGFEKNVIFKPLFKVSEIKKLLNNFDQNDDVAKLRTSFTNFKDPVQKNLASYGPYVIELVKLKKDIDEFVPKVAPNDRFGYRYDLVDLSTAIFTRMKKIVSDMHAICKKSDEVECNLYVESFCKDECRTEYSLVVQDAKKENKQKK